MLDKPRPSPRGFHYTRWVAQSNRQEAGASPPCRRSGQASRSRPPSRASDVLRALAAVPALLLLYVLILIPLTPSISDIRKAASNAWHRFCRRTARNWPSSSNRIAHGSSSLTSRPVINALIATEDHRFYDHFGLELAAYGRRRTQHLQRRPPGQFSRCCSLARNLPGGDRPRTDAHAQDQGIHHGPERSRLSTSRTRFSKLPQHRPFSIAPSASKWRRALL